MKITRLDEDAIEETKALISSSFAIHAEFYTHRFPIRTDRCIMVAKVDSKVVGVAGAFRNSLHPDFLEILIAVGPNHRRKYLATELLTALRTSASSLGDYRGLRAGFYRGLGFDETFLEKRGFTQSHVCRCLVLAVDQVSTIPESGISTDDEIMSLGSFLGSVEARKAVLDFLWKRYSEEHVVNPPKTSSVENWAEIALGEIDLQISVVMVSSGSVVGVTTCGSAVGDAAEIIWSFANKGSNPVIESLRIERMLRTVIDECRRLGASCMSIEVDETDRGLVTATEHFVVRTREDWVIYLAK